MRENSAGAVRSRRNVLIGGSVGALGLTFAGSTPANAVDEPVDPLKVHGVHNILEFGDPSQSDEQRLKAAMAYFVGLRQEVNLTISRGFLLSDTVVVDTSYISLEFTTGNIDARALLDRPAFVFTGSSSSGYPNTRVAVRGLRLVGPGSSASNSVGIRFESSAGVIRGVGFFGLEVSGFGTGLEFRDNAYLLSFYNFHFYRCGTAVSLPGGTVNSGENIKFIGGGIGTSTLGVYNGNPNGNLHFISTSIDFCAAAVFAESGGVFLDQPHLEFNETGAASTAPHFVTGASTSAKITITGGHLFFHSPPAAPYIFETRNPSWGGGIVLSQVSMYNTSTTTGYLCGGTGRLRTRDIIQHDGNGSGSGNGAIMPSSTANKLVDGTFSLPAVIDAFVNSTDATSRTSSPGMSLKNVSGKLVVTRTNITSNVSMAIDVPCTAGLTYGSLFLVTSATSGGTVSVIESFIASPGKDSRGIPAVSKSDARGPSNIALSTIKANLPYRRVNGPTSWSRVAPAWATHFRLRFLYSAVTAGSTVFDEIVITEM